VDYTNRSQGRVAKGSIVQCFHGDHTSLFTIIQWRPFEHMTTDMMLPLPIKNVFILGDLHLIPTEKGTRLVQTFSKATGPLVGRILAAITFSMLAKQAQHDIDAFGMRLEKDLVACGIGLEA
jgi:hypothetical protein